jgi:HEAT repeat protein
MIQRDILAFDHQKPSIYQLFKLRSSQQRKAIPSRISPDPLWKRCLFLLSLLLQPDQRLRNEQALQGRDPYRLPFSLCFYFLFTCSLLIVNSLYAQSKAKASSIDLSLLPKESVKQITASSVGKGYYLDSLNKLVRWRVWGSEPEDRVNSWFFFGLDQLYYIKKITFQPGDERDASYYAQCGRPAVVRINGDRQDERIFKLSDRKYNQEINFNPPLATRNIKFSFPEVYGKSELGGVCASVVEVWIVADPLKSLPDIKKQLQKSVELLKSPITRPDAIKKLKLLGPIVSKPLIDMIPQASLEIQKAILSVLVDTADMSQVEEIKNLYSQIKVDLNFKIQWTLASLGDEPALVLMAREIDLSAPDERLLRYEAIARSGKTEYLALLLNSMTKNPEIADTITPYLHHFVNIYEELEKRFKEANLEEKPLYLIAMSANDPQRAMTHVKDAFFQEGDPEMKAAAIKAFSRIPDPQIKNSIVANHTSSFVSVRMAVAYYLGEFAKEADLPILEELAIDRSKRVRAVSMKGLGRFIHKTKNILENNAINGPDETTAYFAAKAWIDNTLAEDLSVPQRLLSARHEKVQAIGIHRLIEVEQIACPLLINAFFQQARFSSILADALLDQWEMCKTDTHQYLNTLAKDDLKRMSYLSLVEQGKLISELPRFDEQRLPIDRIDEQVLQSNQGKLFLHVLERYGKLAGPEQTAKTLTPYLDPMLPKAVRVAAIEGLNTVVNDELIALAKAEIQIHLPYAEVKKQEVLIAYLQWIGRSKIDSFLPALAKNFVIWKRSIEFEKIRMATIKAIIELNGPEKIGALMEGVVDLSPEINDIAKQALGHSKKKKTRDYDDLSVEH